MVRVEDLNITFFHLPKNAGTSIANWLSDNVNGEEYHHDLRHAEPDALKPLFGDFGWTFCCVRNPWDRLVSWYHFFKKQGKITSSFSEFVDSCSDPLKKSPKYNRFISDQMYYQSVDYVIRYENLLEDFKVVQQKTNCYVPLGHSNKSRRDKLKYVEFYSKEHYNKVKEIYAEEIEHLGYKFGE